MKISFAPAVPAGVHTLVLGLSSDDPAAQLLALGYPSSLARAAAAADFKGKRDTFLLLPGMADTGHERILLQGLGSRAELTARDWEQCGGALYAKLAELEFGEAAFAADDLDHAAAAQLAFGFRLRSYRFDRYKTKVEPRICPADLTIECSDSAAAERGYAPLASIGDGVFLARDLVNEPPNVIDPAGFVARVALQLEAAGVEVEVLDRAAMEALGMNALLGVARGSTARPHLLVLHWRGAEDAARPAIALVGKGVTFDAGGISLKPAAGMWDMKFDMGGAAAVAGAMLAIAGRRARANVVAVAALVENMPDGAALKPSDVVTSLSGQTIEVLNTDAEGRLILADAITYALRRFRPSHLVDIATLTGAVLIALGHEFAGLFANDDALGDQLRAAGEEVGEHLWRLPLCPAYDKMLDSDIADMKNISTGSPASPGSSIGAQFLRRFVDDTLWAHLDIAGPVWSQTGSAIGPKGATGYGVRILDRWIRSIEDAGNEAPGMS